MRKGTRKFEQLKSLEKSTKTEELRSNQHLAEKKFCPECGVKLLEENIAYCPNCGFKF